MTTPAVTTVLTSAADALTALRHPRVCTMETTWTIRQAATNLLPGDPSGAYWLACRSLDVLAAHRTTIGEDPGALDRWMSTFGRDAMAEQMRAAAQATPAQAVADWNTAHPVGTPVRYWTGVREGDGKNSRTRTPAQVLGGHTAVVWMEGESSCVELTHVAPTLFEEADRG